MPVLIVSKSSEQSVGQAQQNLQRFVRDGGDMVFFEQYRQTNMHLVDALFGVKAGGSGKRGSQISDPEPKAKLVHAGFTEPSFADIPFGNGFVGLPKGSTVLVSSIDGRVSTVALAPCGKGRLILIGNDISSLQQRLDEIVLDFIYSPPAGKP